MEQFDEIVARGKNPFVGSILQKTWEEQRLSSAASQASADDDAKVPSRFPVPVPFTREEWSSKTVAEITDDERFMKFYTESAERVQTSKRAAVYIDIFTVIAYFEGLPDFTPKNYSKLLREAKRKTLTADRLEKALEVVVGISGPNQALPTALAAFEFLTIVHEFASFVKEQLEVRPAIDELLETVGAMAAMTFLLAVNIQFGLARAEDWQLQKPN